MHNVFMIMKLIGCSSIIKYLYLLSFKLFFLLVTTCHVEQRAQNQIEYNNNIVFIIITININKDKRTKKKVNTIKY